MAVIAAILAAATVIVADEEETEILTPASLPLDPCSLTLEEPQALLVQEFQFPPNQSIGAIRVYRVQGDLALISLSVKADKAGDMAVFDQNGESPFTCFLKGPPGYLDARIGPLSPSFSLLLIVNGEKYTILVMKTPPPTPFSGPLKADTESRIAEQEMNDYEEEEAEENLMPESPASAKSGRVQGTDVEMQEVGEEEVEEVLRGGAPQTDGQLTGTMRQTLPLAAGVVTFIVTYLVSRRLF